MSYVLRVRLASFFTGATVAFAAGLYLLHKYCMTAQSAISSQMNSPYKSVDGRRLLSLEKLKEVEASKHMEAV